MNNFNMGGISSISGGQYDTINLEGISSCSDNIKAEKMSVKGIFTCSGEVEAGYIYCEGVTDFKKNIRTKKLVVTGVINVKEGTKIEAEEINCEGVIKSNGEIYADIMKAQGAVHARGIYGDQVIINTRYAFSKIRRFFLGEKSDVRLIEATTVELSGVTAETVNGKNVIIGPDCRINNIDCNGTLSIDRSSTVDHITGEYTRNDK